MSVSTQPQLERTPPRTTGDPPVRMVVVDDHPLYREGIARAIEAEGHLVVAQAADGQEGLEAIQAHLPDVAIVDVSMPRLDGIDVVGAVARLGLPVPIVLLSAFGDDPLVLAGLQAGAAAYATKDADRIEILRVALEAATPRLSPAALVGAIDHRDTPWLPLLTFHEHRLLQLAATQPDKARLALLLGLDEPTVRRMLSTATTKLGATTLPEAIERALRVGLIHADP